MQEQIHEILSSATDFMTAEEIANKGKWRSHGNVKVAIRHMAKTPGKIVSRKSKTKKNLNNTPAEEFALAEKDFAQKHIQERSKETNDAHVSLTDKGDMPKQAVEIEVPVFRKTTAAPMPADKECCNAAKVVATTAGSEVASLNARVEALEEEIAQRNREIKRLTIERNSHRDDVHNWENTLEKLVGTNSLKYVSETIIGMQGRLSALEKSLTVWADLAGEYECKGPSELRVFVNALSKRVDDLKAMLKPGPIGMPKKANNDPMAADYYAVYRQSRGLQRYKKLETAQVEAEVGARVDGKAELYAMTLVDVANVGAVWNGRKAA